MNYRTPKNDVSLAKQYQKNLSKEHCKHGVIDQRKYRKRASKRKWKKREYHVQDNADVEKKYVKMYCDTNQFDLMSCDYKPLVVQLICLIMYWLHTTVL